MFKSISLIFSNFFMKSIIFLFLLSILINVKSYCQQSDCGNLKAGMVLFRKGDSKISASGMFQLNKLGDDMRANPNCKVSIESTASGSKRDLQISWNRTNQVINYMVEKQGIDRERFIFRYGQSGAFDVVNFRGTLNDEDGPSSMPAPFPHLRR